MDLASFPLLVVRGAALHLELPEQLQVGLCVAVFRRAAVHHVTSQEAQRGYPIRVPQMAACNRLTLYASADDKALMASKSLHENPRAGESGDHLVVMDGLDTIDCLGIDTSLFGLNHAYFAEVGAVAEDIAGVLVRSASHVKRRLRPRTRNGKRYWLLPE